MFVGENHILFFHLSVTLLSHFFENHPAEKSHGQAFQGQGHCGKVKCQSATKRNISTTPHEDESVYRI